jgi:hypothetical protein
VGGHFAGSPTIESRRQLGITDDYGTANIETSNFTFHAPKKVVATAVEMLQLPERLVRTAEERGRRFPSQALLLGGLRGTTG